jgi:dihydroflavonol-4-reductase
MRVLITGAGGFIGSHLVDSQLAQGHTVKAVDLHLERLAHVMEHPNLEVVKGDVTEPEQLSALVEGVDVVYHLASAHLDVSQSDEHYYRVNVEGTQQLLAGAHAAGVSRFVHCSTNGVLGEIQQPPADERTPCHPTNIYEQTKLLGERAALAFFRNTDFPVIVARPTWVYGTRCPRTARLLHTVRERRFVMFGNGRTLRHPIYIDDAVRGLELCARHGIPGEVYFLGGEKPVTIAQLVQIIAKVQGVKVPGWQLPLPVGMVAGYMAQWVFRILGKQPPISRRTLDFFMKDNAYDISKARRDLGFNPEVNLCAGLQQILHDGY